MINDDDLLLGINDDDLFLGINDDESLSWD